MRVVAGVARGRPLRAPRNASTRPTSDRVKEALFSMIESLLAWGRPEREIGTEELWEGLRVADLYAGSGALGIEALSRGAEAATFVEADAGALAAIRANLAATGLAGLDGPIDLVLMDPPYAEPRALEVAGAAAAAPWLSGNALLALEHSQRLAAPAKLGTLSRQRERRYGETMLTLYARGAFERASARDDQEGG